MVHGPISHSWLAETLPYWSAVVPYMVENHNPTHEVLARACATNHTEQHYVCPTSVEQHVDASCPTPTQSRHARGGFGPIGGLIWDTLQVCRASDGTHRCKPNHQIAPNSRTWASPGPTRFLFLLKSLCTRVIFSNVHECLPVCGPMFRGNQTSLGQNRKCS